METTKRERGGRERERERERERARGGVRKCSGLSLYQSKNR